MADADLVVKYQGGDADRHHVEMRALGNSLIGFERIISDGLIFLGENRLPRRGERHTLIVQAKEPVIGSSEIPILLTQSAGLLPLGWWLLQTGAGEAISYFVTWVFTKLGGREVEAMAALEAMERMRETEGKERLESQRQWLEHEAGWRDQLFAITDRLANAAIRAVAPVGPSVDNFKLNGSKAPALLVDLPTADVIRAKGELEVTELQTIDLRVDGFVHHSKKLNVEHPEQPGRYISADVRDPLFESVPNAYTEAAANQSVLTVQAKLGYRAGALERIYIMDVGGWLDNAA
ncbi:MAG: hypothetical protein U0975_16155 [Erythrobacter sp.]|nr:hypothetical protein [Erythrobacter sp.]MDZ4274194.1 hypothetical protein [Erythrobacter sp.]